MAHERIQALSVPLKEYYQNVVDNGEQIGLKPGDIDWTRRLLDVDRAITLDEAGKRKEGKTMGSEG